MACSARFQSVRSMIIIEIAQLCGPLPDALFELSVEFPDPFLGIFMVSNVQQRAGA
jgi:hypothetical protein